MVAIEYHSISSSMIQRVGYNALSESLYVIFNNGQEYAYRGVPEDEYLALRSAPSAGAYFHDNIKDVYEYEKV